MGVNESQGPADASRSARLEDSSQASLPPSLRWWEGVPHPDPQPWEQKEAVPCSCGTGRTVQNAEAGMKEDVRVPVTICQECYQVLQPAVTLCAACRALRVHRPLDPPMHEGPPRHARVERGTEAHLVAHLWMSGLLGNSEPSQVIRLLEDLRRRLDEDPRLRQELRTLARESGHDGALRVTRDDDSP